jgi:cytochrome c oxidase cbb3-type subunit 2
MNFGSLIFLGMFVALAGSWFGLVLAPQLQWGRETSLKVGPPAQYYPAPRPGLAQQGREVYRSLGCAHCHSQVVRPVGFGNDYDRGWGSRRTVPRDYLWEEPLMLGSVRVGPDLANVGNRNPIKYALPWSYQATDREGQTQEATQWHYRHLLNPAVHTPGSSMPAYKFLFTERKRGDYPARDALVLPDRFKVPAGVEVVPKPAAQALVAYLLSLQAESVLYEAPSKLLPEVRRAVKLTETNAPAAVIITNLPASHP